MRFVDWLDRHMVPVLASLLAAAFACLLLMLVVVLTACGGMKSDAGTDGQTDGRCGEPGVCEGSATTEPPGCDVPGVDVFDLDGRPLCDGGD